MKSLIRFSIFVFLIFSVFALHAKPLTSEALHLLQKEASSYWAKITGKALPQEVLTFALDERVSQNGNDAYKLVSTDTGACITGSNIRSVWYGLYDLLERRGGCHWFWDDDVVPKRETIDLSGLNIYEEAGFPYRAIRYFAHRGLTRFQAEHWGLDDWKKEIDWCLKRRLNVFMLRIGQDDLFQRTFPDVVSYPDSALPLPGSGKGFNNRSLFWSLEYRGKLRAAVQQYGRERGLLIPEDFGTMTHWYSPTPDEFLEKKKPTFLPQSSSGYSVTNQLVWNVREEKWAADYWKLTTTAVREYGGGKVDLLHTIGLGERNCYTNRADNLKLKLETLKTFIGKARRDYPNATVLLAGWDFYYTWQPDEVKELVSQLDPTRTIIWDYEGDATTDDGSVKGVGNNFTKWGVVGKFPYTYSIFLAYESALDVRANYPLIAERFKIVKDDPMCKGFILWPESSHTDTLALRYFTENAWSRKNEPIETILKEFCASRYAEQADAMRIIWQKVLPISQTTGWGDNYGRAAVWCFENTDETYSSPTCLTNVVSVLNALAAIDTRSPVVQRDVVDLARTVADRALLDLNKRIVKSSRQWQKGEANGGEVLRLAAIYANAGKAMADLLELHTDYSLYESYLRLNAIEPIQNPHFDSVLLDNASNGYCQSHQYELARYFYEPLMREMWDVIADCIKWDRRTQKISVSTNANRLLEEMKKHPLKELRPRAERSPDAISRALRKLVAVLNQLNKYA